MSRYGEMIRELGLVPCHGILPSGHYCSFNPSDHYMGRTAAGIVHFTDDEATDMVRVQGFLKLCATAFDPTLIDTGQPLWRRIYRHNVAARDIGRRLHRRIPKRHTKFDRSIVKAGVAGVPNSVPLRRQAYDWARQ